MSRSPPQPDHTDRTIQEFLEWVPKNCINGTNGPSATLNSPFMPRPDLEAYLKAERRTEKLLRALFSGREHRVMSEALQLSYIRVFTILILIGKGTFIEHVVQHPNLRDNQLPFLEKPPHFPTDPNDSEFWNSFYKTQFAFCAHVFRYKENDTKLEDGVILPIVSKEVLAMGGSAAIYKIELHPYYDRLSSAAVIGIRPAHTYVLKTYNTKEADIYYEKEVDAFKKLATKDEMDQCLIQFLGNYRQGDTYNILLEYADRGTLEDFFKKEQPPKLGRDVVTFWSRLFNVLKALSRIHETDRPDGFLGPDILIGWHQDVKPSNILVISGKNSGPYDVEFKLADLGLSHFRRTTKLNRGIVDSDVGGTKDYGAPECDRSVEFIAQSKLNVSPSIDIWSFGGVCSEAAVWVVLGMQPLIDYRSRRKQEICNRGSSQDGSCFHDGEKLLDTVKDTHNLLLKNELIRPSDHVTAPVLDQMVPNMLEEKPGWRQNANWLGRKAEQILNEAQRKLEVSAQQASPKREGPMETKTQLYGLNISNTPAGASHGAAQPHNGSSYAHDPPPHDPQYDSHTQLPGRSDSLKQSLNRRSETWSVRPTNPKMAAGTRYGNSDPLTNTRQSLQSLQSSPPLHAYLDSEEQARPWSPESDGSETGLQEKTWENVNPVIYSPPRRPRKVNNEENVSVPGQGARNASPPHEESHMALQYPRHVRKDIYPAHPPPPESDPLDTKLTGIPLNHEPSQRTTEIKTLEANQISAQVTPSVPPAANTTAAARLNHTAKPNVPYLSFKDAKRHRERHSILPQAVKDQLNYLTDRDHVFLIDDSFTMRDHWEDLVSLFSVLAYIAKGLDKNGLEMYFTVSPDVKKFKKTTPAVDHLKYMRQSTHSDINLRLEDILRKYQADLEHQKDRKQGFWSLSKVVKPLSLYVLTDGAWPSVDGVPPVEAMIEKLRELGLPKKQVGIQFIRFGNDPEGIRRLEYLDSGLREKYTKRWDIVDTEPFKGGNLLKMLLGAISEWFDDD